MLLKKENKKNEFKNLLIQNKKNEKIKKEKVDLKWIRTILLVTFTLTFVLSFVSEISIPNISLIGGILVTLLFVFIGIVFDIVGVAVTASNEKVFHSMSSRKVKGASVAVKFKKNADKVSSFCCDVVGDVCGIISGSASAAITVLLVSKYDFNILLTTLIVSSFIAAITIGGKAIGKSFAINKSDIILYEFSKFVSIFYKG